MQKQITTTDIIKRNNSTNATIPVEGVQILVDDVNDKESKVDLNSTRMRNLPVYKTMVVSDLIDGGASFIVGLPEEEV